MGTPKKASKKQRDGLIHFFQSSEMSPIRALQFFGVKHACLAPPGLQL